jgi:hypothetical protein
VLIADCWSKETDLPSAWSAEVCSALLCSATNSRRALALLIPCVKRMIAVLDLRAHRCTGALGDANSTSHLHIQIALFLSRVTTEVDMPAVSSTSSGLSETVLSRVLSGIDAFWFLVLLLDLICTLAFLRPRIRSLRAEPWKQRLRKQSVQLLATRGLHPARHCEAKSSSEAATDIPSDVADIFALCAGSSLSTPALSALAGGDSRNSLRSYSRQPSATVSDALPSVYQRPRER